ncbi:DNA polymerase eta-like [Argiope bruennichi]|uniref:DNA polymerase eta n=1 Tax=Argiope bruennichi TaxID=94029 RepID=A0A8T0G0P4_ARGBR|nr:DNA polymerase eta-like [Argiope bruennichi]KAF8795998.1 DNA polymerase eta like protein [Argiope bruennichi]
MESRRERIIVLVDMDCFYVQVEQKLCPEYQNKPCAVVQYNTWKGGGIIAVNYEARARGVKRMGRGEDAIKQCPDIHLFRVPEVRGKADLTRYREAGASVIEVLCKFSDSVERASIDEAYIDLTEVITARMENDIRVTADQIPNTFVVGWEDKENEQGAVENWLQMIYEEDHLYHDRMLATAAVIVEEMRKAVLEETGYKCSAGIAHNKMLSKLSCGLHKPNKQTVLPQSSIPLLYKTMPIKKVRNLGGKLGDHVMEKFNVKTMGDLWNLPKTQFINGFGDKTGNWLYNVSRGIENEPVTPRQLPKSIGCGKNFRGKSCLDTKEKVFHWVKQLASELEERLLKDLESNRRVARLLTVCVRTTSTPGYSTISRSCPIYVYNSDKIAHDAFAALQKLNTSSSSSWNPAILSLAMVAAKFEDRLDTCTSDIQSYFNNATSPSKKVGNSSTDPTSDIDTVLDLMDNEPGLAKDITNQNNDAELKRGMLCAKSSRKPKDISSFFSTQVSGTSRTDSEFSEKVLNKQISLESNHVTGNSEEVNSSVADTTVPAKANISNDSVGQKPKGFFAKKLEEKSNSEVNKINLDSSSKNDMPDTDSAVSDVSALSHDASTSCAESSSLSENSELDPELTNLCSKCNRRIPIWEEEEHADYHLAFDLSKELMKESVVKKILPSSSSVKSRGGKLSSRGRKRGSTTKQTSASKKPVQMNTLDSFFKSS